MDVLMPQLGETVAEGKITQMVQVGRRRGEAGRQPVRDRDRQGVDGGAVDHGRHAHRNPRAGGRGGAGRRRGRGDRRSGGRRECARRSACSASAPAPHTNSARSRASGNPGPRTGPPLARGRTGSGSRELCLSEARSVLRGAHARAQFRPGEAAGRHVGDAAGAPARGRERHRSRPAVAPPVRTAASSRAMSKRRSPRAAARPAWRRRRCTAGASAEQVKALYQGVAIHGSSARRHARDHRAPAGRGQADHPAFLSDRRCRDRRAAQAARGGQCRRAQERERRAAPTSFRSTISSSRRWRWRCSACRRRTRSGPATASCASSIPTSASRWRSTAACSRR